jgi:hypothetical protein
MACHAYGAHQLSDPDPELELCQSGVNAKKPHFEKCAQDYGALSLISWTGCACAVVAAGAVVSRESCLRGPIRGFRLLRL